MGLGFKGLQEKLNFGIRLCGGRHLAQAEPDGGRLSRVPELFGTHTCSLMSPRHGQPSRELGRVTNSSTLRLPERWSTPGSGRKGMVDPD